MKVEDNEMSSSQAASASPPTRSRKQSNPLPSSSPDLPWAYIPTVKLEPIDDTRNDSGVASGSECPSASPSSDRSDSHPYNTPPQDLMANGSYQRVPNPSNPYNAYYHSNFGTPSKVTSPAQSVQAISPSVSPQITATAPTPAASKTPRGKYNFDDIAIPKMNSHGKIKLHKCKQCEFVACTKVDFWEHSVIHIRPEKALRCKDCPFITEFKHHMEYHIMNHTGTKPYKCQLCPYSCVNNSMLRSHMKSHSKIYQYRCEDCLYETKYVHSLKLHLRKYQHKPAVVLNPDGTPNPEPVIDVYGSRRGPKSKKILQKTPPPTTTPPTSAPTSPVQTPAEQQLVPPPPPHLLQYNPLVMSQNGMLPFPIPLIPLANPDLFQNIQMIKEQLMRMAQLKSTVEAPPAMDTALDLSKSPPRPSMNGGEDDSMTTAFENVEVVDNSETQHCNATSQTEIAGFSGQGINYNYHCHFCGVGFSREEIYRIHMDYHGYRVPFLCNMCGYECADCISFFKHIAKSAH